ncbi:MAG: hypothetical protein II289_09560 [Bacteroidales bacterium]|nr:hypothetical protein [Bacteroidales bacterium]
MLRSRTDGDGNQSTDYLEISNADIVDTLSNTKEFVRGNGKKVQTSSVISKSDIDDLFKIFLFAANNTDVEWALHRGQDNNYLLGTSHDKDSVDDYTVLAGDDNAPLLISSVHSHPNTLDVLTMGYHNDTYYRSDQWKVNTNQASLYNYVYFPKSTSLYLAGKYNPILLLMR